MPALTNEEMLLPVWAKYGLSCIRRKWPECKIILDYVEEERERILVRMEWPDQGALVAHTSYRYVFREGHQTYHQDMRNGRLGPKLLVRELNASDRPKKEPKVRKRPTPRKYPNGAVSVVTRPVTVTELMGQRRELLKTIRNYEIDFAKTLDWLEQSVLEELRARLSQLEVDIIVAKEEAEET